jgi:hypothetical protein
MKTMATIARLIVGALTIAAVAAPAAQAGESTYRDAVDRHPVASSISTSGRYSDALDRQRGTHAAQTESLKPLHRGYDAIELARTEPVSISAPSTVAAPSFDWRDAGIGAGATFGATLLLTAAAMLATRSRRVAHS